VVNKERTQGKITTIKDNPRKPKASPRGILHHDLTTDTFYASEGSELPPLRDSSWGTGARSTLIRKYKVKKTTVP
jgi:hypothetical protein